MGFLDRPGIMIDTDEYKLMTTQEAGTSRRNWQATWKPLAATHIGRPDVREDGEAMVITLSDWSRGAAGYYDSPPGTMHFGDRVIGWIPGQLTALPDAEISYPTDDNSTAAVLPGFVVRLRNTTLLLVGRYAYAITASPSVDKDFGAGIEVTSAVIHNDEVVVGVGSAAKMWVRNTSGTWTQATDNTYISGLGRTDDRLWRGAADSGNESKVSNIGPTDNPRTLSAWSTGITVGDSGTGITAVRGFGEQIWVSKPEGGFIGDAGAIFPNVLEGAVSLDTRNGMVTEVQGDSVFYVHRDGAGCLWYRPGQPVREIGISRQFTSANAGAAVPGTRIRGLRANGEILWAVTETPGHSRDEPSAVFSTVNGGTTYTDRLTNLTDDELSTSFAVGGLDTIANDDWFVVGYSAKFYGAIFDILSPATSTATPRLAAAYWNGTAWTALQATGSTEHAVHDTTNLSAMLTPLEPGSTFGRSGAVYWNDSNVSDWATLSINSGTAYYYVRFGFDAAIGSGATLAEVRIISAAGSVIGYLWRGRPVRPGDPWEGPIVWESAMTLDNQPVPVAVGVLAPAVYPNHRGDSLLIGSLNRHAIQRLPIGPIDNGIDNYAAGGTYNSGQLDGGSPNVNKEWLSVTVKGPTISSDRDVQVAYRLDETTAYTNVGSAITASPTTVTFTAGTTGESLGLQLQFGAFTSTGGEFTRVTEIEVRYRELNTMKEEHVCMLAIPSKGTAGLPDADKALDALDTDLRAGPKTYLDPSRRALTATLEEMEVQEWFTAEGNIPALAVRVLLREV